MQQMSETNYWVAQSFKWISEFVPEFFYCSFFSVYLKRKQPARLHLFGFSVDDENPWLVELRTIDDRWIFFEPGEDGRTGVGVCVVEHIQIG
jgi:hypothetical protein